MPGSSACTEVGRGGCTGREILPPPCRSAARGSSNTAAVASPVTPARSFALGLASSACSFTVVSTHTVLDLAKLTLTSADGVSWQRGDVSASPIQNPSFVLGSMLKERTTPFPGVDRGGERLACRPGLPWPGLPGSFGAALGERRRDSGLGFASAPHGSLAMLGLLPLLKRPGCLGFAGASCRKASQRSGTSIIPRVLGDTERSKTRSPRSAPARHIDGADCIRPIPS